MDIVEACVLNGTTYQVRMMCENNIPLFNASDVAHILDVKNIRTSLVSFDENEKVVRSTATPGGPQETLFLTEPGLYRFLMRSRKAIAEPFQKWVSTVLVSIREKGRYVVEEQLAVVEAKNTALKDRFRRNRIIDKFSKDEWDLVYYNKLHPCLYIGIPDPTQPNLIKFGESKDIQSRIKTHKSTWSEFVLLHLVRCKNSIHVETEFKKHPEMRYNIKTLTVGGSVSTELVELTDVCTIEKVKDIMGEVAEKCDAELERKQSEAQQKVDAEKNAILSEHERVIEKYKLQIQVLTLQLELDRFRAANTHVSFTNITDASAEQLKLMTSQTANGFYENTEEQLAENDLDEEECESTISDTSVDCVAVSLIQKENKSDDKKKEVPRIPDMPSSVSLKICYEEWVKNCRDYFRETIRPPWSKQHGKTSLAKRLLYCRLKPFVEYLDSCDNPHLCIDRLDKIRMKHGVSTCHFIKYCFYCLVHKFTEGKPPAIMPEVLAKELIEAHLPIPIKYRVRSPPR